MKSQGGILSENVLNAKRTLIGRQHHENIECTQFWTKIENTRYEAQTK